VRFARALVAVCALAFAAPAGATVREVPPTFTNPVIPGNVADPSVVRAGGVYWATATSGGWAPVFPLFRSSDLVHWSQVGAVFSRPPRWARGNFWAPGLTVHRGVWSVYYSASRARGKPCIAVAQAPRPTGPWRDRGFVVCQPTGSIDPAAVADAAGRRYLVWKKMGVGNGIYGARLSASGQRLASAAQRLTLPNETWEEGVTEGPDIVRNGSQYVLVYSGGHCCRPPCTYAVGVARSATILGPYSKDPDNPVFRGGDGWKCPGHGTLVAEPDGALAYLHHAIRDDDPFDVHRQTLLDPVSWGLDGWPVFGQDGVPVAAGDNDERVSLRERFAGPMLDSGWQWPFDLPPDLRVGGGVLRIHRGTVSRAWPAHNFAMSAVMHGGGRLAIVLNHGQRVDVRTDGRTVALAQGGRVVARRRLRGARALRLDVRVGRAFAAYAEPPRGGWRPVGVPIVAPPGTALDRVELGPGAFGEVVLRPLG
jgi:xylan 1,4-beta-xylosidase